MRLIDSYRFSDHVLADALTEKQKGKAEMIHRMAMSEPEVEAIPVSWILEQIKLPENAGYYSACLAKMLRKWEGEK